MSETKQALFARNLISVCIDSDDNADLQGVIWHQYSDDPIKFQSVGNLMIIMDELYDQWDFPQRGLEQREFYSTKKDDELQHSDKLVIDEVQKSCGTRNVQNYRGKLGTFIVQVSFRQKATWQGRVIYAEKDQYIEFQSAKALIDIMDEKIHEER